MMITSIPIMTSIETLCMGCMRDIGNSQTCLDCGEPFHTQKNAIALPLKTILNERFIVGRVLGKPGGFGITYLAWDMLLETTVAIKEFLPLTSVSRHPKNTSVRANSKQDQVNFNQGLQIFLKEAKTLAQFSHPNIVRIRDYFTSNKTAYLVMEYHQGQPLNQVVALAGGCLSEERTLEIILPILNGLEAVHEKGFLHRDIKPQNIYVTDTGVPLLLDFGASRFALADSTQTLTVMLSAGFAPFEQYHKKGKQGVWSDIYSIGATLYFMTTGKMPDDAIERQHDDTVSPPIKHNSQLSESFSLTVLKAMSVNPLSRPASIDALKQNLIAGSHHLLPTPQTTKVSQTTQLDSSLPIKKAIRQPIIIQYDKQNNSLSFGRILIYVGIVVILWSGWNTGQMHENNNSTTVPQINMSDPVETEHIIMVEENIEDEYVEVIEPFGFDTEMETVSKPVEIEPDSVQTELTKGSQNPKRPESIPAPLNHSMHPKIDEAALTACKYKRPHSQCKLPHGAQAGICLPEKQGRLACFPGNHRRPPPPPPHLRPQFRR